MRKTVCLNMIVKNESQVIQRCLDSIRNFIDYWVIVDTGSEDGTQEIIRKYFEGMPGELHERPWVDFGHNRSEAMKLARKKGDYLLFIDADDRLVAPDGYVLPPLVEDLYSIRQREGMGKTFREHHVYFLVRNNTDLDWKGSVHEYLSSPSSKTFGFLSDIYCLYINDGHRAKDPGKCEKDIQLLRGEFEKNPLDSRSAFYLARTYWSIKSYDLAIEWFKKRAVMGGDPIEVYQSLLYIALAEKASGRDPFIFLASFERAHLFRPSRTEAIYEIARYFIEINLPLIGKAVLIQAKAIPPSSDNLFVENWVNEWGIPLYLYLASLQKGEVHEALFFLKKLLEEIRVPEEIRESFNLDMDWERLGAQTLAFV